MITKRKALNAFERFDEIAQEYAFIGTKDPDTADLLEKAYHAEKENLRSILIALTGG